MKRIVLATPPSGFNNKGHLPPLGLGYIAAVLRDHGFEVAIIDSLVSGYDQQQAQDAIEAFSPDAVGFTSVTSDRFQTLELAQRLKQKKQDLFLFVGGPHFSFTPKDSFQNTGAIDAIIEGEGEISTLEMLQALRDGKNLQDVQGLWLRKNGEVIFTGIRDFITDLNELPFPAWDLYELDKYREYGDFPPVARKVGVISSRGCPYRCSFCSCPAFWKGGYRYRSAENFIDEVEFLYREFGYRSFVFWDDTFTVTDKHVNEVCAEIERRNLEITWSAAGRINRTTKPLLETMRHAGCVAMTFGVESVSPRILKTMHKSIKADRIETVLREALDMGLFVRSFFIFGFPDETMEDALLTARFINKLRTWGPNMSVEYGYLAIFPGTEIDQVAHADGQLSPDFSWYDPTTRSSDPEVPHVPFYRNDLLDHDAIRAELYKGELHTSGAAKKMLARAKRIRSLKDVGRGMKILKRMVKK